jgi:hypothetical protein
MRSPAVAIVVACTAAPLRFLMEATNGVRTIRHGSSGFPSTAAGPVSDTRFRPHPRPH